MMSVNPGFGGQSFIPSVLNKIKAIKARIRDVGMDIPIEVDGGVGIHNIAEIAEAGASMFVAGSAIFGQQDYKQVIDDMRHQLSSVTE